jgi:signal peptidase
LLEGVLVLLVVCTVLAGLLGQPFVVSYVETGSMEPTMTPGDGFVAVPPVLAGGVEPGDVIVYRATEIQGGGLTTHRVVGETEDGYVTRGDANPFTDQASGEPHVEDDRIVAEAVRIGGSVVVLPGLGNTVESGRALLAGVSTRIPGVSGARGLAFGFFAATLVWAAVGAIWEGSPREGRSTDEDRTRGDQFRDRSRTDGVDDRVVVTGCVVLVVLAATAAMVLPAGQAAYEVSADQSAAEQATADQSAADQSTAKQSPETAATVERDFLVDNGGFLPIVVVLEPRDDGITFARSSTVVGPRTEETVTARLDRPASGQVRRRFVEYRYLAVLPEQTVVALAHAHPLLPVVVIDVLVGLAVGIVGHWLSRTTPARRRERSSSPTGRSRR